MAESLQGLCVQVLNFDTTLVLHAWKTLVKEVGRCRAGLGEEEAGNAELGLSVLVQDLCAATTVTFRKCLELGCSGGGGQEFQRHLKACKHLLSLLLVLLRVSSREGGGGRGREGGGRGEAGRVMVGEAGRVMVGEAGRVVGEARQGGWWAWHGELWAWQRGWWVRRGRVWWDQT